jgi:hypothetical protein
LGALEGLGRQAQLVRGQIQHREAAAETLQLGKHVDGKHLVLIRSTVGCLHESRCVSYCL